MNYIGRDKNGNKLQIGDICIFKLKNELYEGMIVYDEESYAFAFEMKNDSFPILLMYKADFESIERIINVMETNVNDEYEFYRKIYNRKKLMG